MRGRPVVVNLQFAGGAETIIKATHNNENIYFNETTLDDLQFPMASRKNTPLTQLLNINSTNPDVSLKWLLYSENLFPSLRNEFSSSTTERTGYDNQFWRDSNTERITLGNTLLNSFGNTVSQSSWPLDAQDDFLTRTKVPQITASGEFTQLVGDGAAGELQNNYFHIVSGSATRTDPSNAVRSLAASALYARKQALASPRS